MKTITLEEIYADPHVLEPLLAAGEPVEIVQLGKRLGSLTPSRDVSPAKLAARFDVAAHRAWFLKTHGPDAYASTRTTAEVFDELRRERRISGYE